MICEKLSINPSHEVKKSKFRDPNGLNGEEPLLNGNKWEPSTLENPQRHLVIDKETSMQEVFKVRK